MKVEHGVSAGVLVLVGVGLFYLGDDAGPGKAAFASRADDFYSALLASREQSGLMELGADRWAASWGGTVQRQGEWPDGERLGTTIPGGRISFHDRTCRAESGAGSCSDYVISIASSVNRTYTVTFNPAGEPEIGYDDY